MNTAERAVLASDSYAPSAEAVELFEQSLELTLLEDSEELNRSVAENIAGYLAKQLDLDPHQTEERIAERTRHVRVYRASPGKFCNEPDTEGTFFSATRAVILPHRLAPERYVDSLLHEMVHAASIARHMPSHAHPEVPLVARNGFRTDIPGIDEEPKRRDRHGEWVNEALTEIVRHETFDSRTPHEAYLLETALFLALCEHIPGLYQDMLRATFIDGSKGRALGRIEQVMGPFWMERVQHNLDLMNGLAECTDRRYNPMHDINESIPKDLREGFMMVARSLLPR